MKQLCVFLVLLLTLSGCGGPANPTLSQETTLPQITGEACPPVTTDSPLPPETTQETPLPDPRDDDLVRVLDYIPTARQALAYATAENFTGQRIYDFTDAYLRYGTIRKLQKVCNDLEALGLGILIWDGFRPVSAQATLWEICPDANFVSHPVTGGRAHCRGSAIDLTLVDLTTGQFLEMPSNFDEFSSLGDREYSDCSESAAHNALLLEQTKEEHGFIPYAKDWWHFSDTDDYPVEEHFDPAVPRLWLANCQEYIGLRLSPDSGELLAKIPVGDIMTLLGWDGRYARVTWQGMTGYVLSSYIRPANDRWVDTYLDTVPLTDLYTYDELMSDVQRLQEKYPRSMTAGMIGTSELRRPIPVLRLGDTDAQYHVLLQGAIHGREHMTSWLLMAMADYWLDQDLAAYGDICFHIIPMVNPDGVVISQTGTLTQHQLSIYHNDLALGYTTLTEEEYAADWKANGLGVDINRNFPAGWESIDDRDGPSSERYQGTEPFSTAEARVLQHYTQHWKFDATVSYHSSGSIIYYEYGSREPANSLSEHLGKAAMAVTGYPLEGSLGVGGAGYKDWAIDTMGIPSLTIEIGCQDSPLASRELYAIFFRNYRLLPVLSRWVQGQ